MKEQLQLVTFEQAQRLKALGFRLRTNEYTDNYNTYEQAEIALLDLILENLDK
jgi:hypothetical protein